MGKYFCTAPFCLRRATHTEPLSLCDKHYRELELIDARDAAERASVRLKALADLNSPELHSLEVKPHRKGGGTKAGGLKARATNYRLYGLDFYRQIGRLGGIKSRGGGFTDPELARAAGIKGGKASRRDKI